MKLTLVGLGLVVIVMARLKASDASPLQTAGEIVGALVVFVVIPDIIRAIIVARRETSRDE